MEPTNWQFLLQLTEPVVYQDDTLFVLLHFRREDIPNWSLKGAPDHLRELYKFWSFIHQTFVAYGHRSDVFMLQLESFIPSTSKEQRAKVSPGVVFLFSFPSEDFKEHIEVATEGALAVANGWLVEEEVYGHENWPKLGEFLELFDPYTGHWNSTKMRRKQVKPWLPTLKTNSSLDACINQYIMYHPAELKFDRSPDKRHEAFDDFNLFRQLPRIKNLHGDLLRYAAWRSRDCSQIPTEGTYRNLKKAADTLRAQGITDSVIERQLNLFAWKVVGSEGAGTYLDLSDYIAWQMSKTHVDEDKGYFLNNRFYEMPMDVSLIREGMKMNLKRPRDEDTDEDEHRELVKRIAHNIGMDHKALCSSVPSITDFEQLYPQLSTAVKMFQQLASDEQDTTAYFVKERNAHFMLQIYEQQMRSNIMSGLAKKKQYDYVDWLHEIFPSGHLNSSTGQFALPMCIQKTAGVEPSQDIMVQHFYAMIKACGVLQLSVEFVMMLLANIIGFTSTDNKPFIVVNGPPGCGKSHTALAAGRIAVGTDSCLNKAAFESQDYATIKSMAADRENKYERVTGTTFMEEWRCGQGSENPYGNDTTMESTTLKNIWDKGVVVSERCVKKDKTEKIMSDKQSCLFSRSFVVLANGIAVSGSLADRFLLYNVPDLTVEVHHIDPVHTDRLLSACRYTQLFSLLRFHIAEGINRRSIGLEIKEKAVHTDLDQYEARLTFSRMRDVLADMGFNKKMLNPRVEKQILLFGEVLARYRAVLEVLGYSWGDGQDLQTDRRRLEELSDNTKALMMEQRTILDPADIVSAATLVLVFSDLSSDVLKAIVLHLLDPNVIEVRDGIVYMRITTTKKGMLNDLRASNSTLLPKTLNDCIEDLECRKTESATQAPVLQRSGNSAKERFDLYVEAETAALTYCNAQADMVQKAEDFMVETVMQFAVDFNFKETHPGLLRVHDGHLVFNVPETLVRTFSFFRRLPDYRCEHLEGRKFKVHADFGQLRVKIAKILLLDHLRVAAEEQVADQDGYFTISVPEHLRALFNLPKVPDVKVQLSKPLIIGEKVHLKGLTIPGLSGRVARTLDTVSEGYVQVDGMWQQEEEVLMPDMKLTAFVMQSNELKVHYMVLDKHPLLHGRYALKESRPRDFVRRMLCKDFTSMASVLCFDRETVYRTQKPEDAFSFVPVPPRDKLLEFWRPAEQGRSYGVNAKRHLGHMTFAENHRHIKLSYKEAVLQGEIQRLRAEYPPCRRDDGSLAPDSKAFLDSRRRLVLSKEPKRFQVPQASVLLPYPQSMARLVRQF